MVAGVAHNLGHGKDHVRGAGVLTEFSVHPRAQFELLGVRYFVARHQVGSNRAKPIKRLTKQPLAGTHLEIAGAQVVGAAVTKNILQRLLDRYG